MKSGIVILSELHGPACARVLEIQRHFDPKLAAGVPPHVTITGSSGMGPIATDTSVADLRAALEPIARVTAPMTLTFLPPQKFMQTRVVVLPLDPHGPLRTLHDRIRRSGLRFDRERFTFTPHVTLNFFCELAPADLKTLLAIRVTVPVRVEHLSVHRTTSLTSSRKLLELRLEGTA